MLHEEEMEVFVNGLTGRMTEAVRRDVAYAILDSLAWGIDGETQSWYKYYGRREFLVNCGLED